jgi:O-antigen/teichoic acid export membrane protein
MALMTSLKDGAMLAFANIYGSLSTFLVLSIIFNSVDLKTFGSISLLLTIIAIGQTLSNTQSWQGLLNRGGVIESKQLRFCLGIDVIAAVVGACLVMLTLMYCPWLLMQDATPPAMLLWITINIALTPPGVLIAVIRKEARFVEQAAVDISATTLKIGMALLWVQGSASLLSLVMTLVLPEIIRWAGYLSIAATHLVQCEAATVNSCDNVDIPIQQPSLRAIYGFSFWGMLTEIIHLPTAHVDKILVSSILGLESLAIWDILKRCATVVVQATTVINQMLFPHYIRMRGQFTVAALNRHCLDQCFILGGFLLLLYSFVTITLPIWFPFAFHVDATVFSIAELQYIFGLLALVMTFVLAATPVHPLFLSLMHSSLNFKISLLGNVMFLMLSALLLPLFGLFGVPMAIFGSDAFIVATKVWMIRRLVS